MHKNAAVVHAWIDGADVEYQSPTTDEWFDVPHINDLREHYLDPSPIHPDYAYMRFRVKNTNIECPKHHDR